MSGGVVWVNGSFQDGAHARDRGLTLGDGVFDTLVAFNGVPFAGDEHLLRLQAQAAVIGIDVDPEQVRAGWNAVLGRAEADHTILRTTVTGGAGGRGLWPRSGSGPTLIVTGTPWDATLFARPARLVTSSISRNPGSPSSGLKSLGYLDGILAAREARSGGGDDALLLTPAGRVACTTIANVFALTGDRLMTPPLSDAVQPGIMRRLVLEAAERLGVQVEERSMTPDDLRLAHQVFLTNSVRFLCPCPTLDGDALGRDGAGVLARLTAAVCAQVLEACGFDPRSSGEMGRRTKKPAIASAASHRREPGIRAGTAMLAVVTGPEEAAVAMAGGADILQLGEPASGALPLDQIAATVAVVAGTRPVWAAIEVPLTADGMDSVKATAALEVDGITLPLRMEGWEEQRVRALAQSAAPAQLIGVLFADREPNLPASIRMLAAGGCQGVMLDVAERGGRLLAATDIAALGPVVDAARRCRISVGLAGALEVPDVPRLLSLRPDFLGFRAALCVSHDAGGSIDLAAVQAIRALIPQGEADIAPDDMDHPLRAAPAIRGLGEGVATDKIFVRDFVLPVSIGAYRHEHAAPQKVRFDVAVEVQRARGASPGMGQVFSYDLLTDGIRALVAEGHVEFVETLADRIAALALRHHRVRRVTVRVQKLELGPGGVGVEIEVRRPGTEAELEWLLATLEESAPKPRT